MRVSSQPLPRLDVEPASDRTAPSDGTPFRSALRAAGRADKAVRRSHEPPPPPAPPPPSPPRAPDDTSDAPRPLGFAGSNDGEVQPLGPMMRAPASLAARPQTRMTDGENATHAATNGALGDAQSLSAIANASLGGAATADLPAVEDSPVAAWVAAAVTRAVGSLGNAAGSAAGASSASSADAAASASSAPGATAGFDLTGLGSFAMTPLEQAVHELIANANDSVAHPRASRAATESTASDLDSALLHTTTSSTSALPARDPARAAAPATTTPVAAPPEPPANPSHVHLVLDDGPERTVVTVAMRGNEVHVAMRSTDDATTAALARNAGSLDHAMRARGLALGELTAEREPSDQRPPRERTPHDRRSPAPTERFEIEETS
jgi:hypothetical protein